MTSTTTSRRALLSATAAAVTAAILPGVAAAVPMSDAAAAVAVRPEFLEAERLMLQREAEANAHSTEVHEPIHQRWLAAVAALPHTVVTLDGGGEWTTAKPGNVSVARRIVGLDRGHRDVPEVRDMRRLVAAHLRRERAIKRLPETAARAAAFQENNRLSDISVDAEDAFFAMRPASLAELAHKLRIMAERQRDYEGCVAGFILPDVLALTARGARA